MTEADALALRKPQTCPRCGWKNHSYRCKGCNYDGGIICAMCGKEYWKLMRELTARDWRRIGL